MFSDLVLIVEGESDKIVLEGWARILDVPLEQIHTAVLTARGVNKTRYHLKLWSEIAKEVGLPTYVFVDKDGDSEVNKVVSEGLVSQENAHALERGSIEDYYPVQLLVNCLQKLFGVQVDSKDIPSGARSKTISKLLSKEPDEWKVPLAEEISKKTERRQIPTEIADFLSRVYNENKL